MHFKVIFVSFFCVTSHFYRKSEVMIQHITFCLPGAQSAEFAMMYESYNMTRGKWIVPRK